MTMPSINHDRLRQQRERRGSGNGWKAKEGANRIRVLPPHSRHLEDWNTLENFAIPYKMHFFRRTGQPTETSRCLGEQRKRCPACEAWRTYGKASDPALAELAKQVAPADNYLFNILDLNNIPGGIQPWGANYTCWDKIMEIGANPMWGNIVDPACGINFEVTLTPGTRSRTGYNQWSVNPEREATTVMEILEQIPNWRATLDALEDQKTPFKTDEEIKQFLEEMGFPSSGGTVISVGGTGGVSVPAPRPAAAPAIGARPVGAPAIAPAAVVRPASVSPTPVAPAPAATPSPAVQRAAAPATAQAPVATQPHYDPGEMYQPVTPPEEIPSGAPRCFGDFSPKRHQCKPCPFQSDCQVKLLESDQPL